MAWNRTGGVVTLTRLQRARRYEQPVWVYFGVIFVILLPWMPRPAMIPFCPKTNA
jgi:hypothetical protein